MQITATKNKTMFNLRTRDYSESYQFDSEIDLRHFLIGSADICPNNWDSMSIQKLINIVNSSIADEDEEFELCTEEDD